MNPTPEQIAILSACIETPVLIVEAGPGCGKSTLIGMATRILVEAGFTEIQCTSFSKDSVTDLTKKVVKPAETSTLNSIGHKAWAGYIEKRLELNENKVREILRSIRDDGRFSITTDEVDDLLALARRAKAVGYLPPNSGASARDTPSFADLCAEADIRPESFYEVVLNAMLTASIKQAYEGLIDFDDQNYMAALFAPKSAFRPVDYLFVDECQDQNPVQLRMVMRIPARHRIFVGDRLQAIYGFRGAMTDSFERIKAAWPDALILPLQTSFRLPKAICALLQEHNPALRTAKTYQGQVIELTEDLTPYLHPKTGLTKAVLCRNNAPLFKVALACIANGIRFQLKNAAWASALCRDIERHTKNPSQYDAASLPASMYEYWYREDMTPAQLDLLGDKVTCLEILARTNRTAQNVINTIKGLLHKGALSKTAATSPLILSTAHKAKGLEFDVVVHLDPDLIPAKFCKTPEELAQEANIAYVINSRPQSTLIFASSDLALIGTDRAVPARPDIRKDQPV